MYLIWIFSGISLFTSLTYGFYGVHQTPSVLRTLCKALPVSMLALISLISGAPAVLTIALALGALGDVFLSRPGERNFLLGLGAFLVGHLAYIVLLARLSEGFSRIAADPWRWFACAILLCIAAGVVRRLLPHLGSLRIPVLVYVAIIVAMGATALTLPLDWPLVLALIGAMMFIASDAILGFELFVFQDNPARQRWPSTLLWLLYWGGQSLILLAVVLH